MASARRATMRTEEDVEVGRTHVGAGPGPASIGTSVARRLDLGKPTRARHARWTFGDANVSPESMLMATAAVWGSYHPTMRLMLTSEDGWETPTPAELNVSRSAITAAMCVAQHFVTRRLSRGKNTHRARDGWPDEDEDEDRERDRYPNARTPLRGEGRRGRRLIATNGGGDAEGRGSDSEGVRTTTTTTTSSKVPAAAARAPANDRRRGGSSPRAPSSRRCTRSPSGYSRAEWTTAAPRAPVSWRPRLQWSSRCWPRRLARRWPNGRGRRPPRACWAPRSSFPPGHPRCPTTPPPLTRTPRRTRRWATV